MGNQYNMKNINIIINQIVEQDTTVLSKLKKSELLAFTQSLLKDYYFELSDDTIKELYNEKCN